MIHNTMGDNCTQQWLKDDSAEIIISTANAIESAICTQRNYYTKNLQNLSKMPSLFMSDTFIHCY